MAQVGSGEEEEEEEDEEEEDEEGESKGMRSDECEENMRGQTLGLAENKGRWAGEEARGEAREKGGDVGNRREKNSHTERGGRTG